jgi:hypothetical protein
MALTFADTLFLLRARLAETTASAWTDAELTDYLYLAEHEVLQLLPSDAFFDIQEVEEEVEASAGTLVVTLPSTALIDQIVNIQIKANAGAAPELIYRRLRVVEPGRASEYAATIVDPVGWFEDGKFYFSPGINENAHTVKFRFVPQPTEGAKIVPDRYSGLVVSYAFALGIAREDVQQAAVEKNEFYQRVAMINQKFYSINKLNRGR